MTAEATAAAPDQQRLDKWLWFARLLKTRTLAARMVEDGHVRLTRAGSTSRIAKPSFAVRAGDVLTLNLNGRVRVLEVRLPGTRRGPAPEAATLYHDISQPAAESPAEAAAPSPGRRPDKQARRALQEMRSKGRFQSGDG